MSVQPIPEGYHTVTPYLVVPDAGALVEFCTSAFDAQVTERIEMPGGVIAHASFRVGTSMVMCGTAQPGAPAAPTMLYLYVEDCDAWYARALEAGASSVQEPRTEFYGDRTCAVKDPQGNQWYFATHVKDVPSDELPQRMAAARGDSA